MQFMKKEIVKLLQPELVVTNIYGSFHSLNITVILNDICLVRLRPISPKLVETNWKTTTVLGTSFISEPASGTVISHYLYLKYIALVFFMLLENVS